MCIESLLLEHNQNGPKMGQAGKKVSNEVGFGARTKMRRGHSPSEKEASCVYTYVTDGRVSWLMHHVGCPHRSQEDY